jgi:hypothetical protein
MADGSFALTVPSDSAMADAAAGAGIASVAAVLELIDYAPLPLREPVRSLVWIRGRVHSVPPHALRELLDLIVVTRPDPALLEVGAGQTLLLLGVDSVVVADATGAEPVRLAELLAAAPDPFCEMESAWLRHLDSDHPEVMARLAGKLPAGLRRGRIRPRHATAGRGGRRRPRCPAAVPRPGTRRRRTGPGDQDSDGLPVRQRAAGTASVGPLP